mmetsp:Transcript_3711/g.6774  ORF Transcript_3711/g.6774 Transcript_3711/m.6774 type:complete len:366 (+) Transcript_3711:1-1098(+)
MENEGRCNDSSMSQSQNRDSPVSTNADQPPPIENLSNKSPLSDEISSTSSQDLESLVRLLSGMKEGGNDGRHSPSQGSSSMTLESPSSIVGSIGTADSILSLCGIHDTTGEHEDENDASTMENEGRCNDSSMSQLQHNDPPPPPIESPANKSPLADEITPSSSQDLASLVRHLSGMGEGETDSRHSPSQGGSSITSNKSPISDEISSSSSQDLESLVRRLSGVEDGETNSRHSPSEGSSSITSLFASQHSDLCSTPPIQSDDSRDISSSIQDEVSVPGSITSFDEVECIRTLYDESESSHQHNPTRVSNPGPYEGWDVLLTELQASGLILRDNESKTSQDNNLDSDGSVSSYGSGSFESEGMEIT